MTAGTSRNRVAITGIGLVTPVGIGVDAFWTNLLAGTSGVRKIDSFDVSKSRVKIAATVRDFDPTQWLDLKELNQLDRFAHFATAAADLALADCRPGSIDKRRFATVISSALGGAATICTAVGSDLGGQGVSPFFIPTSMSNSAASVVARRYGLGGASYSPVSACSSSADAIGQGYRLVRDGYASACLAGGAEACVNPFILAGFSSMRALSRRNDEPEHASRPFERDRDGFVLAEGAAVLLLEPLACALDRGADVYAELCGYSQTNDSFHVTAPRADGVDAARAMCSALDEAGLAPHEVSYVNAHGTGTRLNDVAETVAIRRAFGPDSDQIAVSSTKSMTGHLLGAAGAVEAAVCALAIDTGWVPPTINYHAADPKCDLDYTPNVARQCSVSAAISNSFAFGGHNVSLVFRRIDIVSR